jgi:hypothetical protein
VEVSVKKGLRITYIIVFIAILIVPLLTTNFKPNQVSAIDNRMLADRPSVRELIKAPSLTKIKDFIYAMEPYFRDRLGFRQEMIGANQLLEKKAFGDPSHPGYTFGKDGNTFFKVGRRYTIGDDFLTTYSDYIAEMQRYCEARGAGFYFTINPDKRELYSECLPSGSSYDTSDEDEIISRVVQGGVNYVDMRSTLFEAKESGVQVCNVEQDPGHWNQTGIYYGVTKILDDMHRDDARVSSVPIGRFDISFQHIDKLDSTQIPIDEEVPVYSLPDAKLEIVTDFDDEIKRPNHKYKEFICYKNPSKPTAPKLLVLHGSHLNYVAKSYLASQFSETVFTWSYYNINNLPYYFNIFQPDVVLYEVAERTINPSYIDIQSLKETVLQPPAAQFEDLPETDKYSIRESTDVQDTEKDLADISFTVSGSDADAQNITYAYLNVDDVWYDFKVDAGRPDGTQQISVTLPSESTRKSKVISIMLVPKGEKSIQVFFL